MGKLDPSAWEGTTLRHWWSFDTYQLPVCIYGDAYAPPSTDEVQNCGRGELTVEMEKVAQPPAG